MVSAHGEAVVVGGRFSTDTSVCGKGSMLAATAWIHRVSLGIHFEVCYDERKSK